jgi:hypothetical protein
LLRTIMTGRLEPVTDTDDVAKMGRLKQLRVVAKLVHERNPRALPIVVGTFVGIIVVFVIVGLLIGKLPFLIPLGVLLGVLAAMILGRPPGAGSPLG